MNRAGDACMVPSQAATALASSIRLALKKDGLRALSHPPEGSVQMPSRGSPLEQSFFKLGNIVVFAT